MGFTSTLASYTLNMQKHNHILYLAGSAYQDLPESLILFYIQFSFHFLSSIQCSTSSSSNVEKHKGRHKSWNSSFHFWPALVSVVFSQYMGLCWVGWGLQIKLAFWIKIQPAKPSMFPKLEGTKYLLSYYILLHFLLHT